VNCKDLSCHDVTTKLFKKNSSFYLYSLRSFGDFTTAAILILCVTLAAGQVDHRSTRRTRSQGLSSVQHGGDSSNSKGDSGLPAIFHDWYTRLKLSLALFKKQLFFYNMGHTWGLLGRKVPVQRVPFVFGRHYTLRIKICWIPPVEQQITEMKTGLRKNTINVNGFKNFSTTDNVMRCYDEPYGGTVFKWCKNKGISS